eukprot:jgi/Chlat1/4492/Chrsp29S04575
MLLLLGALRCPSCWLKLVQIARRSTINAVERTQKAVLLKSAARAAVMAYLRKLSRQASEADATQALAKHRC